MNEGTRSQGEEEEEEEGEEAEDEEVEEEEGEEEEDEEAEEILGLDQALVKGPHSSSFSSSSSSSSSSLCCRHFRHESVIKWREVKLDGRTSAKIPPYSHSTQSYHIDTVIRFFSLNESIATADFCANKSNKVFSCK